ncbi:response regulator transcription factor [Dactylosporangium darangshiense]|uniref:Response regulator transcription factor n=1 Tax=Dactylosporangium darangshiense TaxID=579108 RepID=A0ABP8CWT5_9ACTN
MTVRVLVADDQPLVRAGLSGIIGTAPDLTVVAQAGSGREAVDLALRHRPDVVLMDIRMPDIDGIRATQLVTKSAIARVLVLTTFDLDEYVYAALRAGASGFLLKDTPPADLLAAIRIIAAGDALLAPTVTRRLIARFVASPALLPSQTAIVSDPTPADTGRVPAHRARPDPDRLERITDREREVLLLVAEGLSNPEIAVRLHITPGTAKTHVAHLLTKLDVRDRIHLVILAHRSGLIT